MASDTITCNRHGDSRPTYVCAHLARPSVGIGFNSDAPSDENPFPDAWCDDCEIIRAASGGWTEESEKLLGISLICAGCYNEARIRNTRTEFTLEDLASARWKCKSCEEWHTGACLDFSSDEPYYWNSELEKAQHRFDLLPRFLRKRETYLDEEYCVIENEYFFTRGNIHIPIIGTDETFRWGVWGSLSRTNFERLNAAHDDPKRVELEPMFSWLSTEIEGYPSTLNLKMYVHVQPVDARPHFELEHTDHPLSQEYHHGITPARVREIMESRLNEITG